MKKMYIKTKRKHSLGGYLNNNIEYEVKSIIYDHEVRTGISINLCLGDNEVNNFDISYFRLSSLRLAE